MRSILVTSALLVLVISLPFLRDAPTGAASACGGLAATIEGTTASETINGTPGDDVIAGMGGDDTINGRDGNDTICGDAGNDTIIGGDGNDTITPGDGNDRVDGGAGYDTLSYAEFVSPGITADLCAHTIIGHGRDAVQRFERIDGTSANDEITGCTAVEYLYGGDGDDSLTSGGGSDTLDGGDGTDYCQGAGVTFVSCVGGLGLFCFNPDLPESDCDGVPDQIDNCPRAYNPDQMNTDAAPLVTAGAPDDASVPNDDEMGDACDLDDDNDGQTEHAESLGCWAQPPTDPLKSDSDGDHVIDGAECALGSDPSDAASRPAPPPAGDDADGDGLSDAFEIEIGSNPDNIDSDADGALDGIEYKGYGTSLTSIDTDNDGCADAAEIASVDAAPAVNSIDLQLVASGFNRMDFAVYDLNKDGIVNSMDLQLVAKNFNVYGCG